MRWNESPQASGYQEMIDHSATGRTGTPDEVGQAADFLLSDAASFVTGTDLLIDGGVIAAIKNHQIKLQVVGRATLQLSEISPYVMKSRSKLMKSNSPRIFSAFSVFLNYSFVYYHRALMKKIKWAVSNKVCLMLHITTNSD